MSHALLDGKALAEKGYSPLPVERGRKYCVLPGWPQVTWSGRAPGLGLNLEGLAMIDVDLEFSDDVDCISDIIKSVVGEDAWAEVPLRWRDNSARNAYLFQCTDIDHIRILGAKRTDVGRVEYKIGTGEFMFTHGRHPSGAQLQWDVSDDADAYNTVNTTPLPENFPAREELPIITLAQVREIENRSEAYLLEQHGPPDVAASEFTTFDAEFDLRMDMVFVLPDGSSASLQDLYIGPGTSEVVNLTPWRPDSDSCAGHITHSRQFNGPCVADFVTGKRHFLPREENGTVPESVELPGGLTPASKAAREKLSRLKRLIFVRSTSEMIYADDPRGVGMTPAAAFFDCTSEEVKEWKRQVPAVQRVIWDPALPPMSRVYNGESDWFDWNIFRPPSHEDTSGTTKTFFDFLGRLVPDDNERDIVWNWLAHKAQHPNRRSFATVFVGRTGGTGKGTLWNIIRDLWTQTLVSNLSGARVLFEGSYQDSLLHKLWVLVDEVSADEPAMWGHGGRRAVINTLKGWLSPERSTKLLNIKGRSQVEVPLVATMGFSTNDWDGMPLVDDRRCCVVATRDDPMSDDEVAAIHAWRAKPANIGALWDALVETDVSDFVWYRAPVTRSRTSMIQASQTTVEQLAAAFLSMVAEHAFGYYTPAHINAWVARLSARLPGDLLSTKGVTALRAELRRCRRSTKRVNGHPTSVFCHNAQKVRGERLSDAFQALTDAINAFEFHETA